MLVLSLGTRPLDARNTAVLCALSGSSSDMAGIARYRYVHSDPAKSPKATVAAPSPPAVKMALAICWKLYKHVKMGVAFIECTYKKT